MFSKFGPLYSVRVHRNAAVAGPGYYAIIKFYSAGDASRAQRTCNGQRLFQKSPLKVSRMAPGVKLAGLSTVTSSSSVGLHEIIVDLGDAPCAKSLLTFGWMLPCGDIPHRWLPGSI